MLLCDKGCKYWYSEQCHFSGGEDVCLNADSVEFTVKEGDGMMTSEEAQAEYDEPVTNRHPDYEKFGDIYW